MAAQSCHGLRVCKECTALLLGVVALAAVLGRAKRASAVNPVESLRYE
jgi:hypothetical protein